MRILRAILLSVMLLLPLTASVPAHAAAGDLGNSACVGAGAAVGEGGCGAANGLSDAFKKIANILIFLVGAISVIMIIIGGLRYALAGGDAAGLKSAKDTIMYALIGVAVAMFAFALVNFVITQIK